MLYVNITNVFRLSRIRNSPTGIPRVTLEFIRYLVRSSQEFKCVFFYSKTKKVV